MRIRSLLALAALPLTIAGCDLDGLTFDGLCIDACGKEREPSAWYIVGVPRESVQLGTITPSGGHYARVRVGESFTMHLLRGRLAIPLESDTVRVVSWAATNASVATVQAGPGGAATFTAAAPGFTRIHANQGNLSMWACAANACYRVEEIEVLP